MEQTTTHIGRYEILGEVGRGAMGIVYRGRDPEIDRLVAIKTISLIADSPEAQQEFRHRFFVEARAAGRLSHPGIVTIFDVGEDPKTKSPYIVMEHVAGKSLSQLFSDSARVPLPDALRLTQQLAEALDYAHSQGVVHRDIKPANILVDKAGNAKITDFGIAKLNLANVTHSGLVVGTPAYMSPEQLEGVAVDGRSDVFSLGVVLYTMLTGHRPFQGNSVATVSFKVTNRSPLPASAFDSSFPPELDYVIARAMAKDPTSRYQTGRELALDLGSLLRGQSPRSQGDHSLRESRRPSVSIGEYGRPKASTIPAHMRASEQTWIRGMTAFIRQVPTKSELIAVLVLVVAGFLATHRYQSSAKNPPVAQTAAPQMKPDKGSGGAELPSPDLATPTTPNPSSIVEIQVEHHLARATLRIWSDGRLIYTRLLHGEAKKHLIVFKTVEGVNTGKLHLPIGAHQIRVLVQGDGYDQSNTVRAVFSRNKPQALRVRCDKDRLELSLH